MHRALSVSASVIREDVQSALTPLNSDRFKKKKKKEKKEKKKLRKHWDGGVKELDAGGLAKFERP